MRPAPGELLTGVGGEQQLQLRGVEHVVVTLVVVEQRERDRRRAAPGNGLDAARGNGGGGRKLLEHPQRLVGREHGDGGAELDPLGRRRCRGDQGRGRGQRHRAGVVLAEAEEVQADVFGELHRLQDVTDRLRGGAIAAVGGAGCVAEAVDAEF